ncbi:hypothetical protein HID58_070550 [Brassica napus]|uniref:Uncharacterized protein n=1 Tax=Brassica napus TaxID=3708 RepID=A0ABQ7YZ37_BRANA|nr:hypothetical protein HID58_070550 [Brassica napus]
MYRKCLLWIPRDPETRKGVVSNKMLMELKISVDPEILEYVNLLNCCVFSLSYMQVAPSMVVTRRRLQSYLVPSFSSIVANGVCVCVEKHKGVCRRVPCFTVLERFDDPSAAVIPWLLDSLR